MHPLTDAPVRPMIRAVGTRSDLPTGTVTFLFTDIEGSTRLLHSLGADGYADALATHRRILRDAFAAHGGVEVDTQGDAFFVAFPTAPGALAAARQATERLAAGPIQVRIGLHTGSPLLTDEGYVGPDVHKGARIAAAGHGGQILVSAATAALLEDALQDLGLHRLKDLAAPERIFQADDGEHPPLRTLHQTNLPIPATPFLGRDLELAELAGLLARDDVRLLTLTGPGGTGKTRLALQAAAAAADAHPAGVRWVPLAALRDPALVLESAGKALGATGDLAEHIGDQRLLLLLDNFEHLADAAADLAPILAACPNLTLLVTSRQPLHLAGEHEYAVDPLQADDAVALFLTRALAARRDVTANGEVAQICERLDRLPLAIELAAARVKLLSPAALLERLEQRLPLLAGGARDAPERQRTLRATIEWSHELLTPDEQALFARLAVFRGGWTLEAAEAVTDADLDTLQSLVDKSLVRVRPESGRHWMMETIREFAVERLEATGETDALRQRHADHFIGWVEQAEALIGPDHRDADVWIPRLSADHDNLRAVLDWALDRGDGERAQQLAGALWKFWYMTGAIGEGDRRLRAALALDTPSSAIRARALNGGTAMALESGDEETGIRWAREALEISRSLGDPLEIAHAEFLLANAEASRDNWAVARPLLEHAREQFRTLRPFGHYALLTTRVLSWVCLEMGDREIARTLAEQNLLDARAAGNARIEAMTLGQLAFRAVDEGRIAEAASLARQSYRMKREQGDLMGVAGDLYTIARLLFAADRPISAAEVLSRCSALYAETGAAIPSYDRAEMDDLIARIQAAVPAGAFELAQERGHTLAHERIDALLDELVPSQA